MAPTAATRLARHADHCRLALDLGPRADVRPALVRFRSTLRHAWRLPCANTTKEPLWRLAINSFPGCTIRPWRCPCDLHAIHPNPRNHAFWSCPAAQAVRAQLAAALGPATPSVPRVSLWLLTPPPGAPVHPAVWTLVGLCALAAMDFGRAFLWAHRHSSSWPDPGPAGMAAIPEQLPAHLFDSHIWPHVAAARATAVTAVSHAAAARFWHLLQDFALANPHHWALPADHPFLCTREGRLTVHLPAEAPALPAALHADLGAAAVEGDQPAPL